MQQSLAWDDGQAPGGCLAREDGNPVRWPTAADWAPAVLDFFASECGQQLSQYLADRLAAGACVYPPHPFRALALTPLANTRVVILGQDPYHGPGQAQGLAFSVPPGTRVPPSLRNMYGEIDRDTALSHPVATRNPRDGSLEKWASQGVLLLNTCLTVEAGKPASHAGQGWERFTDQLIARLAARDVPLVFMLWGAHAQAKQAIIEKAARPGLHCILCANHPSPLSARRPPRPFVGCGHFSLANAFLQSTGGRAINW